MSAPSQVDGLVFRRVKPYLLSTDAEYEVAVAGATVGRVLGHDRKRPKTGNQSKRGDVVERYWSFERSDRWWTSRAAAARELVQMAEAGGRDA